MSIFPFFNYGSLIMSVAGKMKRRARAGQRANVESYSMLRMLTSIRMLPMLITMLTILNILTKK